LHAPGCGPEVVLISVKAFSTRVIAKNWSSLSSHSQLGQAVAIVRQSLYERRLLLLWEEWESISREPWRSAYSRSGDLQNMLLMWRTRFWATADLFSNVFETKKDRPTLRAPYLNSPYRMIFLSNTQKAAFFSFRRKNNTLTLSENQHSNHGRQYRGF